MGMIGHLRAITMVELGTLQQNPDSIEEFLQGDVRANAPNLMAVLERVQKIGLQAAGNPAEVQKARLEIVRELAAAGVKLPVDGPDENGLSLEKSWHSLHYLLTGSAQEVDSPLGNAILGGKEIGPDLGYGPARFLGAAQVREVSSSLNSISKDDLARRFDLNAMMAAKIYACGDEEELELAQHYFEHLVKYYAEAANRGDAMLLYIE
jgi:hypothetical protein